MKKTFLMVLALCGVSALHAVTTSWVSNWTSSTSSTMDISGSGSFTVVYTFTCTADNMPTYETALFSVKTSGDTTTAGNYIGLGLGSKNGSGSNTRIWVSTANGNYFTKTLSLPAFKEGENKVALIFNRETNNCTFYDIYINGTKLASATTGYKFENNNTYYSADYTTLTSNGTYEGTLYYTQGIASDAEIASVPEPTTLALLALGIAGLALKRKVA